MVQPDRPQGKPGSILSMNPGPVDPFVDLIIELREPSSARTASAQMSREGMKARSEALASRVESLRVELAQADPETPVQIGRTFSRVLFGSSVRVRREQVPRVAKLPSVAAVHLARKFAPLGKGSFDAASLAQSALRRAVPANRGAGVTVAVIDSGIDYNHPAFGGGFGAGHKVIGGWDFANDDADPMDDQGHGTHVAGIIAADGGGLTGVAPDVSLIAYKVIGGSGFGTEENILAGIERAVDPDQNGDPSDHVDIVNMSLGASSNGDDPVAAAVERASAAGVFFCVSNGNGGDYGNVPSPALAPSALSVGAAESGEANGEEAIASFSSRGPSFDYSIKPEVIAPGVEILSSIPNGKTAKASGTSMASPHVAGIAALVKELHRDWSPALLKAAVVTSSRALDADVMSAGAGRADSIRAVTLDLLALPAVLNFGQDDSAKGEWSVSRTVTLRNVGTASRTLTATTQGPRAGVAVVVTPSVVTLAPGETKNVELTLTVTNALVPVPREGSLSYGGRIEWTGAAVPLHLPWAFVKAAFLTIEDASGGLSMGAVIGQETSRRIQPFISVARILWPLETVDVLVSAFSLPVLVDVVEQVQVEGAPVVHANVDDATLTIEPDTTDETGQSLLLNRECHETTVLGFPHGQKAGFDGAPDWRTRFAVLSPRIRLYLAQTCGDAASNKVYAVIHPPLNGLEASVKSTVRPQWQRQDVRFQPDIPRDESMTEALVALRFPGSDATYYYTGGQFFLMRGTASEVAVYYTKSPSPEVDLLATLNWWGRCYDAQAGHKVDCPIVDETYVYLQDEAVIAEGDVYRDISPIGYEVPVGVPITFGGAPVFPFVRFDSGADWWGALAYWNGPLGERLTTNTANASLAMYDSNGTKVGDGRVVIQYDGELPPGRYRIESIDRNFVVAGVHATATFNGSIDTRNADNWLPIFTGLRVEDKNERQAAIVGRNAQARLLFSAADLVRNKIPYLLRVPPREEATRVEYRAHGGADWHSLPVLIVARHYPTSVFLNGGVGTMYQVDLGALTSTLIGAVDVRLSVEDLAGNRSELRLEPAFWIGDTGRRYSVRH